mmetsp:Transcript_22192/g.61814  ORF Transcript_22192/g.61814 Transcript_22192/m.61814 type:complete len:127 (-) Transcript_22192:473-853(-)
MSYSYSDLYDKYTSPMNPDCPIDPPCPVDPQCPEQFTWEVFANALWIFVLHWMQTGEVMLRGFSMGFGLKLAHLMFRDSNTNVSEQIANSSKFMSLSVYAGFAMATIMVGSSLFVPAGFREQWFNP